MRNNNIIVFSCGDLDQREREILGKSGEPGPGSDLPETGQNKTSLTASVYLTEL